MPIRLTWDDTNPNEDAHEVYRAEAPLNIESPPEPVAVLDPDVTHYNDPTAVDGVTYFYRVAAVRNGVRAFSDELVITTAETYTVVALMPGSGEWEVPEGVELIEELLVQAGGGGGGMGEQDAAGGGGGAGGVRHERNVAVTPGALISYTVGAGGAGSDDPATRGGNGSGSSFGAFSVLGGGGGGSSSLLNGLNGGSGGGGGTASTFAGGDEGFGTAGQGEDGGAGNAATDTSQRGAGGGGGATMMGDFGWIGGGHGGDGIDLSEFFGENVGTAGFFAGGGGGGLVPLDQRWDRRRGGLGGGGRAGFGTDADRFGQKGKDGTGGGGGGGANGASGGDGGSGIILIRYGSGFGIAPGQPQDNFAGVQIGDEIAGGIYAGVHTISGVDYHIIAGKASSEVYGLRWHAFGGHDPLYPSDNDGRANTDAILAQSGTFPAAFRCRDYSETGYRGEGYRDWYLPSRAEARLLSDNLLLHPEFAELFVTNQSLWTSTKTGASTIVTVIFATGQTSAASQTAFALRTRPIRRVPV